MSRLPIKQFFNDLSRGLRLLKKEGSYREYAYNVLKRFQWSKADGDELKEKKGYDKLENNKPTIYDSEMRNYSPEENDLSSYNNKWKPEIAWLGKALEQALQLYKWALPTGDGIENKPPPTDRSLAEIFSSIQRSKLGVQDWSLSDLTIGLYLVYLQQASTSAMEDVKGEFICSESIDDIIPRLSVASLTRLRNEIVETDWVSVLSREDWKGVIDLVTNAKQVVSSVQDVARKLADYAKFRGQTKHSDMPMKKEVSTVPSFSQTSNPPSRSPSLCPSSDQEKLERTTDKVAEDLFVPGTLYYLKRNLDADSLHKHTEYFTLLRRQPSEHFQKILLSSNIISDHKCDSHYYALRDVLKGLPSSSDDRTIDN
ncbi:UNVERIFIED_CONTAM: hypothetical protein Sangu_0363300 [Sesamum angustifolium]|uniref:Uncharacterized protein n=1 Tax=Sesamum angustifolium TaxID=2727405 RepID=A0AAW2QR35_9LAMI